MSQPIARSIDTGTDELRVRVQAGVAYILMHRPERRNALTPTMIAAMARVLEVLDQNDEVGCVVLTGAGGAFCAGGDVVAMASGADTQSDSLDFEHAVRARQRMQRAVSAFLWEMPKPTIAAIEGPAAGAGLSIALACDLRYAAPNAVLTTAFAKVGLSGDYGASWFLTQLVGTSKARELLLLSDRVSSTDALRLGMINGIFPAETFASDVSAIAERLSAGPRLAYASMKDNLNAATVGTLRECLDAEAFAHLRSSTTEDHRSAAQAFADKRIPTFVGR